MQIEMYRKRDKDGTSSVESDNVVYASAGCKSLFTLFNALRCVNGVNAKRVLFERRQTVGDRE